MGTSGTDKFHEYGDSGKGTSQKKGGSSGVRGGTSGSGPKSGTNKCSESISNISLEEVARCSYFGKQKDVPSAGTAVSVSRALVQGRIAVVTDGDEVVGYLPVEYNYLRRCTEQGFSYSGQVVVSALKPIPAVRVTLSASQK